MWQPNRATFPFSQHLYNDFFHPAVCSWSNHRVTPWCLQHHVLPKVGVFQLSPCWDQLISWAAHPSPWKGVTVSSSHYARLTLLKCTIKSLYNFTSPYWSAFILFFTGLSMITTSPCHYPVFWMCPVYPPCYSGWSLQSSGRNMIHS